MLYSILKLRRDDQKDEFIIPYPLVKTFKTTQGKIRETPLTHPTAPPKIADMNTRPNLPMVINTMVMSIKMEMFCHADWKAR